MSDIKFEFDAAMRADVGKGASRRLRHANSIPAIVYGAGQSSTSLTLNHDKVMTALKHEAFYSHILTLKIDGKAEKVILKALQRHPTRPRIQHMDFLRIKADQKLHMHIPLHFIGEDRAPGLKEEGVFSHTMSDVEVSCLPADLPEYLELDVSGMVLDQTLHLTDLKLPKGVELVAFAHGVEGHDHPVISIHKPRIIVEEEIVVAPVEGEEGTEPTTEGAAENTETEATDKSAEKTETATKKEKE